MKQTLKQRIIPEVDERETERESEKVASYVEESLKEIAPIDGGDPLFDTDELFDELEEMKDMTDDFFGDDFSFEGADGFAGDVLFEEGPADTNSGIQEEMVESLQDVEEILRESRQEGMKESLEMLGGSFEETAANTGMMAFATRSLGKILKGGAATIMLGGIGLAILGGLWSTVKGMAKHSPLLGTVVEMLGMVTTFLIRPFAHMIGQMLLPIMMDLLQVSAKFMSISFEEGIMNGMIYLGKTFLDAIFSLPGLIAVAITAVGGAIGAYLGAAAAAKIGGTIGAILGSVVPGIGTTVGAAVGATIGVTLAGILGVLTAYNLEGIKKFFKDMTDGIDLMKFVMYAILGPFGVLAIEFFDWMKNAWNKEILPMVEYLKELFDAFSNGGLSAVFDKVVEDTDVRSILKDVIPDFDVWETIKREFPGWPTIPTFDVWSKIKEMFPGWPSIPKFDVWSKIEKAFPGWPDNLSWEGWGSFVDNVDLDSKVPEIDWNVPELPSRSEIAQFIEDSLRPGVDAELEDYMNETESNTGDSGGSDDSGSDDSGSDDGGSDDGGTGRGGGIGGGSGQAPGGGGGTRDPGGGGGGGGGIGGGGNKNEPVRMASGGIVTDTILSYVGEGRESEVVLPLSKLDGMLSSRSSPDVSSLDSGSDVSERELQQAIQTGFDQSDAGVNDEEMVRQLRKIVRAINRLEDSMDLNVELRNNSKWEVNE